MKQALIFSEEGAMPIVSADEVKSGLISRNNEFVDPEYEFRVSFVSGAKNGGGPYFRLYYSYEEYARLFPDKADKYQIVANMRHYQESKWHLEWKNRFKEFCTIEKYIKNKDSNKYKYADAYYEDKNICIEYQHSYIDSYFEERNEFYSELDIKIVWLYDLTSASIREKEGKYSVLEDNAKGFFRIAEKPVNLKSYHVFVQFNDGRIYRISRLDRKDIDAPNKSTVREFIPDFSFTPEEFVEYIKVNGANFNRKKFKYDVLLDLWDDSYKYLIVRNTESNQTIMINRDKQGLMFCKDGFIKYKYYTVLDKDNGKGIINSPKEYSLKFQTACTYIWEFIFAKNQDDKIITEM